MNVTEYVVVRGGSVVFGPTVAKQSARYYATEMNGYHHTDEYRVEEWHSL